ncbi:uncharacterized protein LOC144119515 [Amblyomma americanum]
MEQSPFRNVLRRSRRHELCLQCLRTVQRSVGKQARPYNASRVQMMAFVREVFGEDVYTACTQQLQDGKKADGDVEEMRFHFRVRLLDAEGLFDSGYRRYAHCRLWADEGDGKATEASKRKWFPDSTAEFCVEVPDPSTSSLVLELLARDPQNVWGALRKLARPSSPRAFLASLRQLLSYYFKPESTLMVVGRLSKPLQDIPCVGVEEWYGLVDSAGRNVDSKVQLSVTFHTVSTADVSVLERIREHYALSFVFLEHNVENTAEDNVARWTMWSDCVGRRGLTLLRQHALQNNMQDVEAQCCYLQAVTEHRMKVNTQISYVVMYLLLKELQMEMGNKRHDFVSDALDRLMQGLSDHINTQLVNLHDHYYLEFELHTTDLSGALSVCALMEVMSSLPIVESARTALQKNEKQWYDKLAQSWEEKATLSVIASTLHEIRSHHQKANRLFQQSWNETYTNIVIKELDDFLVCSLRPWVVRQIDDVVASVPGEKEKTLASIEAFSVIKNFLEGIFLVLDVDAEGLRIHRFREWFGPRAVDRWFQLASRASAVVVDFVANDDLLPCDTNVKYSSSFMKVAEAVDANVVKLWIILDWAENACSFAFVDSVRVWVSAYAAAIENKIDQESCSEGIGSGAIPARQCVAVNDLMAVYRYVEQIRAKIVDRYLCSSQGLSRFADVDIRVRNALNLINASKQRLLDYIVRRLLPEVELRLEKILRAQTTLAQEADVDVLLRSVMACVTALSVNLEAEAFEAVLCSLWDKMTTLIKQAISRMRTRCGVDVRAYSVSYLGLSAVIQQLPKCFTTKDCGGLPPAAMAADVSARLRELKEVIRDQNGAGDV